jgi:alpha-tubulin suppressor-like RCC1 family protein
VFAQRCAGEVDCLVDDDPECAGDRICLPHGRWSACQLDAANDNEQCRNPNACVPSGQPDEQCDGIDDDCDGLLDEAVIGRACIAGPAACQRFGETTCVDGAAGCSARAATVAECHLHRHGLVSAGGEHSCAIAGNGQVKCWGFNDEGQLGIGDRANRGDAEGEMGQGLPVAELDGRAVIVSAGRNHTCALLEGGAVKCWGNSDSGRLGLGDLENRGDGPGEMGADLEPVPLGGPALALASGAYHNCVIMDGGVVKCWGQNEMGQLGLGDQGSRGDSPGEVSPELMAVPLEQEAIAIVAGERHSCALLIGGDVKCWGWNVDGQLGQGDSRNRGDAADELGPNLQSIPLAGTAVGLAAGTYHTCAVMEGGAVKCWGANRHGQLAHVNQANSVGDEAGEMGEALPALELGGPALSVTAGIDHTCALMESGVVQCWGGNDEGQLGLGDLQDRPAPNPVPLNALAVAVSAGDRHNCALLVDGRVRCWGKGANGQLGQGSNQNIGDAADELGEALEPIDVGALSGVDVEIPACDGAEICNGIDDDCDGLIDDGALADGPCVAGFGPACQRVGVLSCDAEEGVACSAVAPTIEECAQRQISLAARNHTCVIGVDGQLRCWGPNSSGQLGIGLDVEIWGTAEGQMGENLPAVDAGGDVLQVTAGGDFTCALLVPGVVKCWGNNQVGQLGGGAREDRGDQAEEMGDSLVPVDLAGTAVAIDAGERHVCALLEDQSVKCWGQNGYGQLAQGDRLSRGINAIEMGENLHAVPLGLPIAQITAGAGHNCALSSDGQVLCWGLNRNGQLGVGDIEDRGDDEEELQQLTQPVPLPMPASSIDAGGGHTCALLVDGSAYCWGSAAYGEIGSGDRNNRGDDLIEIGALQPVALGEPAVAISAGGSNSCALFANGALKCWGGNGAFAGGARGKLGLGDQENRGDEPDELGENLPRVPLPLPVVGVEVGRGHVCAVLVDGSIRCWGAGSALGRESSDFIGDDPGEVEQLAAIELGIELSFEEPQRGECLGSPECIVADMQAQCSEGRSACLPSGNRSYCYSIAEQQDEACNGLDDDCDGTVDEQAADVGGDCATAQQGVCGRGSWACIGGELECLPGYEATPEVCNLEDDDCDGEVDEDTLAGDACEAGPVACRSEGTCVEQAGCSVEMPAISECATRLPATLGLTGDGGCVIVEQGQVRCWGRGIYGHLGTGNTDNLGDEPNELGEALNAIALNVEAVGIDCGEGHCCVTTPANLLKCWGNNYVGQLGLGDNNPRGDNPNELGDQLPVVPFARPVLEFTTGGIHTCALFDDGARCWGDNAYGQLGYGDRVRRGIEPNEIRDLAPIGIGIQIEHIQAGFGHTCAIVAGGGVRCWGQNNDGQLGLGDRERRGDEAGEMLDIADVPLGAAARKLALGSAHTCALLTTGEVVCWGGNAFGQLGIGSTEHVGISAASVARPLQRVPLPEPALDVVAERGHTCALLEGGAVQCWGRNEFGQLGIEGRAQIGDDPGETESGHWLVRLPERAIQIRAGNNHVCAILESGRAGCWGANNFGQLGLGNTISRGLLPGDLGEGMQFIDLGAEIHFEPLNE